MQYGRHAIGEALPCKMELSNPEDRFVAEAGTIVESAGPLGLGSLFLGSNLKASPSGNKQLSFRKLSQKLHAINVDLYLISRIKRFEVYPKSAKTANFFALKISSYMVLCNLKM